MNLKKKLLDEIETMNLTDLEKTRYLYIRLGELLTYDPLYCFGNEEIRNEKYNEQINMEKMDSKIVCSTWSHIYSNLLKEQGIDSQIVQIQSLDEKENSHRFVTFNINGKEYVADATCNFYNDLIRLKYKDQTIDFVDPKNEISFLNEIDLKLGYEVGSYIDKAKSILRCEDKVIKELEIDRYYSEEERVKVKFEYLLKLINNLAKKNIEYIDTINFLHELLNYLENTTIFENGYYRIDGENIDLVSFFKLNIENKEYFYLLRKVEDRYLALPSTRNEIEKYEKVYKSNKTGFFI